MDWFSAEARDWLTFLGAVGGGVTGALNLWWKATEKADKIHVGWGSIGADDLPQSMIHVVSRCDHPIEIADYGYVLSTGRLFSLPDHWAHGDPDDPEGLNRGTTRLAGRSDSYEVGTVTYRQIVGCYARTSTQRRVRLAFRPGVSLFRRLRVWAWIRFAPYHSRFE